MNSVVKSHYLTEYQDMEKFLPGHDLPWLMQIRELALEKFSEHGFPTPREEDWRYTNVTAIEKKQFSPVIDRENISLDEDIIQPHLLADAWNLVLVDGRFSAVYSDLEGLPEAVIVCCMADALKQYPELIQSNLGQAITQEEHGFMHFNTAWFSDGLFMHVPENTQLKKPLQLLHFVTQSDVLATTRNLIITAAGAEMELVESYAGNVDTTYLTANVSEIFIAENARLTLTKLQNEAEKAYHFGGTYVKQAKNARLIHNGFAFGSLLARNEIYTDLHLGSECELNGLYLGNKRQLIDNFTRINHLEAHAKSRETYKGILDQRAKGVFQGRVIVHQDAQQTDSEMNNRNLLLSDDAEADTKPQLEIYADDVKCAHGVTVGQLDEKAIFYLQSRNIAEETARNMLTFAFANEMVSKISHDGLHTLVLEQLLARFPQASMSKEWL